MEVWKPIPGWEGLYEASDHGPVRSLDRVVVNRRGHVVHYRGRVLKQSLDGNGYPTVGLSRKGRSRTHAVHVLIARTFLGPGAAGLEVCHWDGNPQNNRVGNLRWDTPKGNGADATRHGRTAKPQGEASANAKLTREDVQTIRARRADGATLSSLAREYRVGISTIHRICTGKAYVHHGTPNGRPVIVM